MKTKLQHKSYKIWAIILIVIAIICMVGFFIAFAMYNQKTGANSNSVVGIGYLFGAIFIPVLLACISIYLFGVSKYKKEK